MVGSEAFQISEFFKFSNICINFMNRTSLIPKSQIQDAPNISKIFGLWSILDFEFRD
jgi:hypothetical protein